MERKKSSNNEKADHDTKNEDENLARKKQQQNVRFDIENMNPFIGFSFLFQLLIRLSQRWKKNTRNIKSLESLYTFSFYFLPHCSILFRPFCMCVSMTELKISASEFNRLYVPCLFLFSSDFTSFILFISFVFFSFSVSLSPFLSIKRRKVFFQTKYAQKNGNFDSVTFVFCYLFLILGKLFFSTHTRIYTCSIHWLSQSHKAKSKH